MSTSRGKAGLCERGKAALGTRGGCSTCSQAQGPILALHPLQNEDTKQFSHHGLEPDCCCAAESCQHPPATSVTWMQILGVNPWIWLHSLSLGFLHQRRASSSRNNHQAQLATHSSLLAIPTSPSLSPQIPEAPRDDPGGATSIFSRVGARHCTRLGEIIGSGRAGGGEGKCLCAGEQRRPSRHASSARCGAGMRGRETRGRAGVSQLPAQ